MPDPVPVMVLARLAVHREWQGRGIGKGLVREAVLKTLQASRHIGISAIIVHALRDDVRQYYEALGFRPSPLDPLTLMISLKGLARKLGLE
jgi:predicted N-acetyltransferase YhbS